jgi:drug/metabolite transporter (DMT)-like permease
MPAKWATLAIPCRSQLKTAALLGPFLMTASAFLYAVVDGLIKVLGPPFNAWDIAFYRFGCGMVLLVMLSGGRYNPFTGHNRKLLIFRGITGFIAFLALILAIQMIPISTALVIFYAYPAFAALFSALFFKEKLGRELVWVLVALVGVGISFDFKLEGGITGQAISLVGAAFAGAAVAAIKELSETNGSITIYLYFCITGAAISIIPFASDPHFPGAAREWIIVGGIVCFSLIAQIIMNQGFLYCRSWEGAVFLTSEVVFVSLWGIIFLLEPVTWHFYLGGPLILGSIIALNLHSARGISRDAAVPAQD